MAIGALKKKYVYHDDSGKSWIIKIAEDRANTTVTGLTLFNPASPPANLQGALNPKRCRRVYAQGTLPLTEEGGRQLKRQFICEITGSLYTLNVSQNVSYQGDEEANPVTLVTTGRRGERITF